jgi:RNA 2',3'-cyclic 3'-phosphodiesterase
MPRLRTFIAVEMSPRVISRAGDLIDELRVTAAEITWVRPQQMHVTLKFLGDVPDTETPDICRVVSEAAASFEPFEITLRGAGAFPNLRDPRTLWIGIEDGSEELKRLQSVLDDALKARLGYPKEQRGFHPHLTIGRVKRAPPGGHEEFTQLLEKHAHFDADLAIIDEVVTFASFLGRKGPTHDALDHAILGASTSRDQTRSR